MAGVATEGEEFRCNTAPGVVFATREELHVHYKSEWHRYNLNRKLAGLAPVPKVLFDKLQVIAQERENSKNNVQKKQDHLKKTKRRSGSMQSGSQASSATGTDSTPASTPAAAPAPQTRSLEEEQEGEADENEYEIDMDALKREVNVKESFLDGHVSNSVEENLEYMRKHFGFFIPDAEYLNDVEGLVKYCTQKVRAGKLCLFCDKPFPDSSAALQHMKAKSHCKISWETDEDAEEYEEFYDYTPLLEKEERLRKVFEATYMDTGELMIKNNETGETKIVGHRAFATVYKQRVPNEDSRESVVAASKERLLLSYKNAGVDTSSALAKTAYNGELPAWMNKNFVRHQRKHQLRQGKLKQRDGMQINMQIKNRLHEHKQKGVGFGVHG